MGIFNSIKTLNSITPKNLILFLLGKKLTPANEEYAKLVRHVIGFDEPLTMKQILAARNNTDKTSWSKNTQIFNSLSTSYTRMQTGGGKILQKGGENEMNLKDFTKFVNCGQYRDKSQNTFDCYDVKFPEVPGAGPVPDAGPGPVAVPLATVTPVDSTNITLEVNEISYTPEIKVVTVNMYVPNESKVIVKNYTHLTEAEETSSLLDGLPKPEIATITFGA